MGLTNNFFFCMLYNIINIMSSIAKIQTDSDSAPNNSPLSASSKRAKAMAQKYISFQKKKRQKNQKTHEKIKCIIKLLNNTHKNILNAWKTIIPVSIRGALTPYETIEEILPSHSKTILNQIPFSKSTLNQCIMQKQHAVLITYPGNKTEESIRAIHNNQNIILITRSKIAVLPIRIQGISLNKQQRRINEIVNNLFPENQCNNLVLVVKKGLFQQIIVLDSYNLSDIRLYEKVLKSIDERESFQSQVKSIASYQQKLQESCQPFADKPTNSTRSQSY